MSRRVTDIPRAHPAAVALRRTGFDAFRPTSVERLGTGSSSRDKSLVYRIAESRRGGRSLIAKNTSNATAELERLIYDELLPSVGLTEVRCYASCPADEPGRSWLFLSEAVGEEYDALLPSHRNAVASLLARLHLGTANVGLATRLPDAGVHRSTQHLERAIACVETGIVNPAVPAPDRSFLRDLLDELLDLQAVWPQVVITGAKLPHALVHGDVKDRNIRIQENPCVRVAAYDWECSGWGPIAVDVSTVAEEYVALIRRRGVDLDLALLEPFAQLLRMVACVQWAAESLAHRWPEPAVADLRTYVGVLRSARHGLVRDTT
jgi:hypothetical protein